MKKKALSSVLGMVACCGSALASGSDHCGDAAASSVITGPGTYSFNTTGADESSPAPECTYDYPTADLFWSFTPAASCLATISGDASAELGFFALKVTAGCNGETLACVGDVGSQGPLTVGFIGGQTYTLRVGAFADLGYTGTGSFTITLASPPDNDECSGAFDVLSGAYAFNDTGASPSLPISSCSPSLSQRDVWFRYLATTTGHATVVAQTANQNTNIDSTISVYSSCSTSASQIDCGSRYSGLRHWAWFPIISGQEYLVRLARPSDSTGGIVSGGGTLQFEISEYANGTIAQNVTVNTATNLTAPGDYPYNNFGVIATDTQTSCSGIAPNAPLWYKYTPTQTGILRLRASAGSNRDVILDVFNTASSTSSSACHTFNYDFSPVWVISATQGVPVWFRILQSTFSGNNDFYRTGTLHIEQGTAAGNDSCANALPANIGSTGFNTVDATQSTTADGSVCTFTDPDVWFSFTAPRSGVFTFHTCSDLTGSEFTTLSLYQGCGGAQLACNNDLDYSDYANFPSACKTANITHDYQSLFKYTLTNGTNYRIRVGSPNNAPGQLNILAPVCIADHNQSGTVTVQDIFSFLSAWFGGNISADANSSGTITVQDIFFFLSRWFAGC